MKRCQNLSFFQCNFWAFFIDIWRLFIGHTVLVLRDRFSLLRDRVQGRRRGEMLAEDLPVQVLFLGRRRRDVKPVGRKLHLEVAHSLVGNLLEAVNPLMTHIERSTRDHFNWYYILMSYRSQKI